MADILLKHKKWVSLLPRVEPFYGKFSRIPLKVFLVLSRDSAWITGWFYIDSQKKKWILLIFCWNHGYSLYLGSITYGTLKDMFNGFIFSFFFPAIKCNNDPVILKMLTGLGIGFDCASKVRGLTINKNI